MKECMLEQKFKPLMFYRLKKYMRNKNKSLKTVTVLQVEKNTCEIMAYTFETIRAGVANLFGARAKLSGKRLQRAFLAP
jgi:hypothetical protein